MSLKLLKELPVMFFIALIIWIIVFIIVRKNHKSEHDSFVKKHKSTPFAIIIAIILTMGDVWLFVFYIPSHFKKNDAQPIQTLSVQDINDDTSKIYTPPVSNSNKKDSPIVRKDTVAKTIASKTYSTNKASIQFLSSGSSEDIEATNSNTVSTLNSATGQLRFVALITGFHFDNELMQNHFNDKEYMNSTDFPKAEFSGSITNLNSIKFTTNGNYPVTVTGNLTIHGVTKPVSITGTLIIAGSKLTAKSIFKINPKNYGITSDEIADNIQITVTSKYD
jgi:hemerythrin